MASRTKRKNRDRPRRPPVSTEPAPIPPGLPGGPPYASAPKVSQILRGSVGGAVGLYLPERLAQAAQKDNPISQYIRARQCLRWRIPCSEWRDR